jgi:hypothetical protein
VKSDGGPAIKSPGLYNIADADYHADPAPAPSLSAGIVEILTRESPLHAWTNHPRLNPAYKEEVKEEFDIGSAAHALLFEGIDNMMVFDPAEYPNAKGGGVATGWTNKAIRAARDEARAQGRIPVLKDTASAIRAMVDSARKAWEENTDLKGYSLDGGKNEWSIIWQESNLYSPGPGKPIEHRDVIWCRCKPDHLSNDRRVMVDAKFTDLSANPASFEQRIARMGYDCRGAWYARGNAATGGAEDTKYFYMNQEIKPPYATSFCPLAPSYMELGARKVERAIAIWRECMASGKWPAYGNRAFWMEAPAYEIARWEEQELRGIEYDPAKLWEKP